MGCTCQKADVVHQIAPSEAGRERTRETTETSGCIKRADSNLGSLHKAVGRSSSKGSSSSLNKSSIRSELDSALSSVDWEHFDWRNDCLGLHEGSMKVVGCLKSHPGIAVASVLRGTGEELIRHEIRTLDELAANGIRTLVYDTNMFEVAHFDPNSDDKAKAYLLQYFNEESCFLYEEGEPGTEDHVLEPIRKLKLLDGDEGDWVFNRDTIKVLKENKLEHNFMQDLTAVVKLMVDKGVRVTDFQGVLGKDGHFYLADPLELAPIGQKVNKYLLEGLFMNSVSPKRENKPKRAAFVEGLGIELGVTVPDEE